MSGWPRLSAPGARRVEKAMDEDEFDQLLKVACTRDLAGQPFPVVHLGTFFSKRREGQEIVFRAMVMATGVTDGGRLEPLAIGVGDSEETAFWARFLLSLKARHLEGVRVVASGEHGGLREALEAVFPEARWHPADTLEDLAEDAEALVGLRLSDGDAGDERTGELGVPCDEGPGER